MGDKTSDAKSIAPTKWRIVPDRGRTRDVESSRSGRVNGFLDFELLKFDDGDRPGPN